MKHLAHRAVSVTANLPDHLPERRANVRKFGPGQYPDYIDNFCSVVERNLAVLQTDTAATRCMVHFDNPELNSILRRSCRLPEDFVYVTLPDNADYAFVKDAGLLRGLGPIDTALLSHSEGGSLVIYSIKAQRQHIGQMYIEFDVHKTMLEVQHSTCIMVSDLISLAAQNVDLNGQRALNRLELMNMTLGRLKEKDQATFEHSERVSSWSGLLANRMGLSEREVKLVIDAGYLHDVGKTYIPKDILYKRGALTKDEYELVRKHAEYGSNMLSQFRSFHEIAPIVRSHHERWDGRGYPDNLAGDQISIYARILSVIDAVEAIVSERTYRPALHWPAAIKEVKACSGSQFDPLVVDAFIELVKKDNFQLFSL